MFGSEKFSKFLEDGEVMRWNGAPQPYGLFDEAHKTATAISLCWALAWGVLLVGGYYALCVYQGQEVKLGVMIFCALIPVMLGWSPVADKNNVKKLRYAVTDKKVIVVSSDSDKPCTMRVSDIDGLRVEQAGGGNFHIRVGTPVFKASARKLPGLAQRGDFDTENNEKTYKGLVFYNVNAGDCETICGFLKPSVKTA